MAPKKIKQHKCEHCEATFDRSFNLKRHVRTQHKKGDHDSVCDICGKTFSRKDHMKTHRKSHFGGDGNIVNVQPPVLNCDKCHKTFKWSYNLRRHQREQHRDEAATFQCSTCGKVFQRADHLKKHMKVHVKRLRPDLIKAGKFVVCILKFVRDTVIQYATSILKVWAFL